MTIAILAFIVFLATTITYTILGNMYHLKVNLFWLFAGSVFNSIGFVFICNVFGE